MLLIYTNNLWLQNIIMSIDKFRKKQHQSIRRVQIETYFKQKRLLFQEILHQNAQTQLIANLSNLSVFAKEKQGLQQKIQFLYLLHKISQEYKVIDYFCQYSVEDRQKKNQGQCQTYIDLLLGIMLRQDQRVQVFEEVSHILSNLAQQLKRVIEISDQSTVKISYIDNSKKILQLYPYQKIKQNSPTMVINSLRIIYNLSNIGKNSVFLYYMINRTSPSLLKNLHFLYHNKRMMDSIQIRQQYIITCLTLAYFIYYYRFQHHQHEYYEKLGKNLREAIVKNLHGSGNQQDFSSNCEYLMIMSKIGLYLPSLEEFCELEQYFLRSIDQKNTKYFRMLQQIMYKDLLVLNQGNFKVILKFSFQISFQQKSTETNSLQLLLSIIKYHFINSGNRIRQSDYNTFLDICGQGQNISNLIEFSQNAKASGDECFKLLMASLSYVINSSDDCDDLIGCRFYSMLKYPQYRMMLQSLGFYLIGQEENL